MHRLVAYAEGGVQRFVLDRDEMVLGAGEECDIRLPFAGVGERHARLLGGGDQVRIEDLGARKGLVVNGERVKSAELEVLDEVRLGSIALLLEDVTPDDGDERPARPEPPPEPTVTPASMLHHLARISQWVLSDSASSRTLESLVLDLLEDFGGGALYLFQGLEESGSPNSLHEDPAIKFVYSTDSAWLAHGEDLLRRVRRARVAARQAAEPEDDALTDDTADATGLDDTAPAALEDGRLGDLPAWIAYRSFVAVDRPYLLVVALPRFRPDEWSPLAAFRTLGDQLILGLVHHVGRYEPILFGRPRQRDLTLAPGLVVGESGAMKKVLDQLRAAVDLESPVLIRGESGVSKELLARSLHLSGSRAEGPFVVVVCEGAREEQIEAELFGAEIQGKTEVIEREGALLAADGGTLYLDGVEHLPLRLQDRLMRFLRKGEVEARGSLRSRPVDVRLIAASEESLESYAARDLFRLDLAYRLGQFVVEVPALRERREDLPLLIQAAVNRCCHETGKRIQGISVKAMEALATHDYPGNLPELEALVRRQVYLCPPGRPIDESSLPDEVRLSTLEGLKPDVSSDLDLDRLVADTERAAIREALRRSRGNKSEAARQLGLSRNGLTMKMKRLGLEA